MRSTLESNIPSVPAGRGSVACSDFHILDGGINLSYYAVEGYQPASAEESAVPEIFSNPGYFRAVGLRLLTGRDFVPLDSKQGGVIVNRAFVRKYFRGRNPLGKHIQNSFNKKPFEIVGVVPDIKLWSLRDPARPIVYLPSLFPGDVAIFARTRIESVHVTLDRTRTAWFVRSIAAATNRFRNSWWTLDSLVLAWARARTSASIAASAISAMRVVLRTKPLPIW